MRTRILTAALAAAALITAGYAAPTQAAMTGHGHHPSHQRLGTTSLADVLTSDGNKFDHNSWDYDIVTEAVLAVLAAKPDSPVGVLTDGSVKLTAFIPNDQSFKILVRDLTGAWPTSEKAAFTTIVNTVGVDAVESVLLYHVVPGARILAKDALQANGAELATALPDASFKVKVIYRALPLVQLVDKDSNDTDPFLNPRALDLNKGNRQVAHGILLVLRPLDL